MKACFPFPPRWSGARRCPGAARIARCGLLVLAALPARADQVFHNASATTVYLEVTTLELTSAAVRIQVNDHAQTPRRQKHAAPLPVAVEPRPGQPAMFLHDLPDTKAEASLAVVHAPMPGEDGLTVLDPDTRLSDIARIEVAAGSSVHFRPVPSGALEADATNRITLQVQRRRPTQDPTRTYSNEWMKLTYAIRGGESKAAPDSLEPEVQAGPEESGIPFIHAFRFQEGKGGGPVTLVDLDAGAGCGCAIL